MSPTQPHPTVGRSGLEALGDSGFRFAAALLPGWLGDRFEAEMRETFHERQRDALATGGAMRLLRTTVGEVGGVIRLALQSRLKGRELLSLEPSTSAGVPGDPQPPTSNRTGFQFMDTLLQDLRYALRGLRKSPGFTAVAVITLMLGIGVNTTIFGIVNAALLRPLPVDSPGELIDVYGTRTNGSGSHDSNSYLDYLDLREQSETLSGLIAYTNFMVNLALDGRSEIVIGEIVSGNYFEVLGVQPALGRAFSPDEFAAEGTHPVTILSDYMWRTRFAADPSILGQAVRLNGISYTVVGVAGPEFGGMMPTVTAQLWVPLMMTEEVDTVGNVVSSPSESGDTWLTSRGLRFLWMRGRLAEGTELQQARAELTGIMARLAEDHPISNELQTVTVLATEDVRFNPDIDGAVAPVGALILAVVGMVLLVACANIANMLLARASARRKEVAIRLAIGAGRGRLVRQLLTESLILSLLGGASGLLLAAWMIGALARIETGLPVDIVADFGIDARVFGFTVLISVVTGVVFGLVPALRASRPDLVPALKDADAGARAGRGRWELRDALVVAQVAVSIVLLIGGALMARSLFNAERLDIGFDVDRIGFMTVGLDMIGYESEAGRVLFDTARLRLEATPGVQAVSLTSRAPQSVNNNGFSVFIDGHQSSATDPPYGIDGVNTDEHYFDALELSILQGRGLEAADVAERRNIAVITQAMAERYWPNQNAVGQSFRDEFDGEPIEIVGVVENYKVNTPGEEPTPYMHRPSIRDLYAVFLVRSETAVAPQMRQFEQVLLDLDPEIVFMQSGPIRDLMDVRLLPIRLGAWFIGSFAALAMALAAIGLYGVIGYSVSRRTREIGIRMALGAEAGKVLRLVVRQGMVLVLIGIGIGAALGALAGQLLSSVLYGMSPVDPIAFGGAIGLLTLIAVAANYIPARRAARIDPIIALRSE